MLSGCCKGSGEKSRRLRGTLGSPQCSAESVQYRRHLAGTVVRVVHCTKGLATWVRGLESSCTLLKGALARHEMALSQGGFSVN